MVAPSEQPHRIGEQEQSSPATPSFSRIIQDLRNASAEFTEYARYLIALEVDRSKLLGKRIAFFAAMGAIGMAVMAGFLAVGTGLLLIGVAGLIGSALNSFWLGATIVGLLMFLLTMTGAFFGWRYVSSKSYRSLRLKYAERRQRQKHTFGRDIKEVARG